MLPGEEAPDSVKLKRETDGWAWRFLYLVAPLTLIKPDSLRYIGLERLDAILVGGNVVLFCILLVSFAAGVFEISQMTRAGIIYFLAIGIPALADSGNIVLFIMMAGPAVSAMMLVDLGMASAPKAFARSFTAGLLVLYSANLVSIIIYHPDGMYRTDWVVGDTYLMGFNNSMIYGLLPMVMFSMVWSVLRFTKVTTLWTVAPLAIALISVAYTNAVSGVVELLVFCAVLVFARVVDIAPRCAV